MISGIDVSHHNGQIDWAKRRTNGLGFAFLKATEGSGYVDSMFARNLQSCRSLSIPVGAYHFFRPEADPAAQADIFIRTLGAAKSGDLPPVLDWEVSDNIRSGVQIARARALLDRIESVYKRIPIIYGSPSFLRDLGIPDWFVRYPLWIANYGVKSPHVPGPWKSYTFWQTSDAGGLDLDIFNGTADQLNLLRA